MALFSEEAGKSGGPEQVARPAIIPSSPSSNAAASPNGADRGIERGSAVAYLDRGTRITGQIRFEGPARIDGHVEGEIDGKEVTIGESATVSAHIRAESVVVCGDVNGEITASRRIEIRSAAKVTGNITAPVLVVQEGAQFNGKCAMNSAAGEIDRPAATNHKGSQAASSPGA